MRTEDFELRLQQHYTANAREPFIRARPCPSQAHDASWSRHGVEFGKRVRTFLTVPTATATWRNRARQLTPAMACLLLCLSGCSKQAPREFSVRFEIEPTDQGRGIMWSLRFTTQEYHRMIEATDHFSEGAKVHELVAAGFKLHHIVGCSTQEKSVIKLDDGSIAFIGACTVAPHGNPAGAI